MCSLPRKRSRPRLCLTCSRLDQRVTPPDPPKATPAPPRKPGFRGAQGAQPYVVLALMALLALGGYFLVNKIMEMDRIQDCVMSRRSNCAPIDAPSQ